ncbi:prolyl oligopeptidase family serine peptidase [Streptomyces sp. Isolate_45]|uniref:S9 family peptidase n=1 Tax=Streptomyces sp. Isolate_45 TaxID=2950111 RepID=UPI002481CC44|nr:prolyl oligopeptidase family serine peptidase [Streptomyces sp. Isolate_45]MDA5280257.1 prolyl oligopeptidase family serine peptidase [Streptomyces sp. Isolate_45]
MPLERAQPETHPDAPEVPVSEAPVRAVPAVPEPAVAVPAPAPVRVPDAHHTDPPTLLTAHGCWYPSADPTGDNVAFICDRAGVPQLWSGPAHSAEAHVLDADPDPVTEVSWSPDGRWIAYTRAPGGGEHTRVLVVRPDGTGRRVLAGAEPGGSAHLGCWTRDGSALAVTLARSSDGGALAAYLIDPDGTNAPVLLFGEAGAASLRVCDMSADGRFALLRRGPRGHREALVLDTSSGRTTFALRVADGDPWIGRFSPDARTLWLRSDAEREHAALLEVRVDEDGAARDVTVAAGREESAVDLLALPDHGRWALLVWNVQGAGELEGIGLPTADAPGERSDIGPHLLRPDLPHEVVTRLTAVGRGTVFAALSGSGRRPGVWQLEGGTTPLRTPWSARDEDAAPPGRPPVRPVPLRCRARDGLMLGGWYYRCPDRDPGRPGPCVIHLHGGPEEQERPVFNPLYHELLGRGLDVFAPDVRGSSGWGRSFVDADLGTGRFAAIDDVADCAAHVVSLGYADPLRLGVMGRSYGGYLTMASLVRHPALFRTGVAVCGMSDFATFFAGTEPWIARSAAAKYGHPEHDRELLHDLSPMSRVHELRVPVLAVHGEHDTNVPLTESEQFVRAARERGLPAELLVLRNEGHDFLRADNRRTYRRAAATWLERHLDGAATS